MINPTELKDIPIRSQQVHQKYVIQDKLTPRSSANGKPLRPSCASTYFLHLTKTWDQVAF